MKKTINKQLAHSMIDHLPEDATWDDLMYQIYVRESIEKGLDDAEVNKLTSVQDVRKEYGLSE